MTKLASQLDDFPDLLRAAADSKNIRPAIVEKDYYLVRALQALQIELGDHFILKGGTSLSKGWDLLDRFSEDIDLLLRIDHEGKEISKGERERRLKKPVSVISNTEGFTEVKKLESTAEKGVHRTAEFKYSSDVDLIEGLSSTITLEMGVRGGTTPVEKREIQSIVGKFAAAQNQTDLAEDLSSFTFEILGLQRTFVEKLFAIHAVYLENHAQNKTRHYYDIYKLCEVDEVLNFVGSAEYRDMVSDVKAHSEQHFPDTPLPENDSFAKSPAFAPTGKDRQALESNYKRERHLFFKEPPSLEVVLNVIGELLPSL